MEFNNLIKALNDIGEMLVNKYREKLENEGINASGKLSNSAEYRVEINDTTYEVQLWLEDYWRWVENGRKAGKFPPINKVREWIKVKPVIPREINGKLPTENQLAYLISRKIALKGIEAKNVLSRSLEDIENNVYNLLLEALVKDLEEGIDFTLLKK